MSSNVVTKPFMTYQQQVEKLIDKKLVITDKNTVIQLLKDYSYFDLINGYKKQFKSHSGDYKPHTTINDIIALYTFDDNLRSLFLQYILKIEKHIKSHISYIFCLEHGNLQETYLDKNNYEYNSKTEKQISMLITTLQDVLKSSKNYAFIEHQKNKYENVPLWVLMKVLTLGKVSKMYAYLPQKLQNSIGKEFGLMKEDVLLKMLDILTHCRNVCAHSERLYDHSFRKSTIGDTPIHSILKIQKRGNQYTKGKSDLFAVVISLKTLLHPKDFDLFFVNLKKSFDILFNSSSLIPKDQLLKIMGFPHNWQEIESISVK